MKQELIDFLKSPEGQSKQVVYFNKKGEWCFSKVQNFTEEVTREEILGEESDADAGEVEDEDADKDKAGKQVKVTKSLLKKYPHLADRGIQLGDVIDEAALEVA